MPRRWAWRLGVATSLLGLALTAAVVSGLVASWAYLRAVYGVFGTGASIASLLIAGMVLQVLGLYPGGAPAGAAAPGDPGGTWAACGRGPRGGAAAAALLLLVLPLPVAAVVHGRFALQPLAPVSQQALTQSLALLRAHARWPPGTARRPALAGVPTGPGPVHVTLWQQGRPVLRVRGEGADLAAAVEHAGGLLSQQLRRGGAGGVGRLKLDRTVARGPVPAWSRALLALSVDPGLDGLDAPTPLTPSCPTTCWRRGWPGRPRRCPPWMSCGWGSTRSGWWNGWVASGRLRGAALTRFRVESWIEGDGRSAAGASRAGASGRPHRRAPPPSRPATSSCARSRPTAGSATGTIRWRDEALPTGVYSIPRHAGTALRADAAATPSPGKPRFRDGAAAALGWLALHLGPTCGGSPARACLVDQGRAGSGRGRADGDRDAGVRAPHRRCAGTATAAAACWRSCAACSRTAASSHHLYDADAGVAVPGPPRMFASEQAALALVLGHRLLGDPVDLAAAERALDFLTGPKYDFFLGRFIYGSDHWTCIAAEEAWPALRHRRYLDFCTGYAGVHEPPAICRRRADDRGALGSRSGGALARLRRALRLQLPAGASGPGHRRIHRGAAVHPGAGRSPPRTASDRSPSCAHSPGRP